MRLLAPVLLLVWLAACGPVPQAPAAPVSLKPANLLTPRPTLAASATPDVKPTEELSDLSIAVVPAPPTLRPTATPAPKLIGTPVAVSEPLQGFLRDDRLTSPIIGESFAYRIYLPP